MTLPSQDRSYRAARCHLRWSTPRCAPSSAPGFGSALALWFDTFVLALQSARSPRTHGELLSPTDPAPGRTHGRGASPCAELRLSFVCPTLDTLRMSSTPSLLCYVLCVRGSVGTGSLPPFWLWTRRRVTASSSPCFARIKTSFEPWSAAHLPPPFRYSCEFRGLSGVQGG